MSEQTEMQTQTLPENVRFRCWNTGLDYQPWTALLILGDNPQTYRISGYGNTKYEALADLLKILEHEQQERDKRALKERLQGETS